MADDRRANHTCHARGCAKRVKPEMLMCRVHWFMVPMAIRDAVWRSYRRGQCDDMNPSKEWHQAADAAIGAVAARENQPLRIPEVNALTALGFETYGTEGGGIGVRKRRAA